jgi:IclR family transcriptional regulator, acetate operon repressor
MSTSVRQSIRILELLAPHPEGLRVSDLAESLAANRAIPHKLLNVLMELGYVEQDPSTERYRATFRLGALGLQQVETAGVRNWAAGPLNDLARDTEELVRLAVASGGGLFWIAKAQGSNSSLKIDSASGAEVVLHATATGKAWLSAQPPTELDRYLEKVGLEAQTSETITDEAKLRTEVEEGARRGFAITQEEMDIGISAVAVPILVGGRIGGSVAVGTVSVAGPAARLTQAKLKSFVPALRDTADTLASFWPVYEIVGSDVAAG